MLTETETIDTEVKEIETLLDEVETELFLTANKRYNPKKIVVSSAEASKCECTKKTETNWAEVDELLKEFKFEDQNPFSKSKNKPWNRQPVQKFTDEKENAIGVGIAAETENKLKCIPAYLSGSSEAMGYSQAGFEKPCDKLKCLKCDFGVEYFDNYSWDSSVNYLFLRNNMPDFDKVASKLRKHRGSRAYACQCQHVSISKITNVKVVADARWVCGKHPNP